MVHSAHVDQSGTEKDRNRRPSVLNLNSLYCELSGLCRINKLKVKKQFQMEFFSKDKVTKMQNRNIWKLQAERVSETH